MMHPYWGLLKKHVLSPTKGHVLGKVEGSVGDRPGGRDGYSVMSEECRLKSHVFNIFLTHYPSLIKDYRMELPKRTLLIKTVFTPGPVKGYAYVANW
ncbi:MAG: hypothetical protein VST68_04485 [Nitrospirota bacterium]|nr:hypothetical protein [Nitrospirota bacterium]